MRSHVTSAPILALLALLLLPALAIADEIQLQNGDRITGTVVRMTGGNLTFKTTGGDITIPWNTVTSLTSTMTLRVRVTSPGRQTVTAISTIAPGQLMLTPGGQVPFTAVEDMGPIEPRVSITRRRQRRLREQQRELRRLQPAARCRRGGPAGREPLHA